MADEDSFVKELEFIQNVIDRQADNSFKIKGWTITLVVVTLLFRGNDIQLLVAFVPLFGFWCLDAYYLRLERQYRALYNYVRENSDDSDRDRFDMDPSEFKSQVDPIRKLMRTNSVGWFYGTIFGLLVVYLIILALSGGQTGPAANA